MRGFLIVALIALVVVVLQLYQTLAVVGGLLGSRSSSRSRTSSPGWRNAATSKPGRSAREVGFYGGAFTGTCDLVAYFWGFDTRTGSAFCVASSSCLAGYAMWRVWRDQHTLRG